MDIQQLYDDIVEINATMSWLEDKYKSNLPPDITELKRLIYRLKKRCDEIYFKNHSKMPNDTNVPLAQYISSNRAKLGISVYKLSKLTGVQAISLHEYEKGVRTNITLSTLEKLKKVFEAKSPDQ